MSAPESENDLPDALTLDTADVKRIPWFVGGVGASLLTAGLMQYRPEVPDFPPELMLVTGTALFFVTAAFLAVR